MRPRRRLALTALLSVPLLTGCAASPGPVPDALLTPAECPAVPAAPSDRALAGYLVGLASCAEARGGQIEAVAEILRAKTE